MLFEAIGFIMCKPVSLCGTVGLTPVSMRNDRPEMLLHIVFYSVTPVLTLKFESCYLSLCSVLTVSRNMVAA